MHIAARPRRLCPGYAARGKSKEKSGGRGFPCAGPGEEGIRMGTVSDAFGKLKENRFVRLFLEQYTFRTAVFSLLSLAINVGFATVYIVSAVMYQSVWYATVAAYNMALILCRTTVNLLNIRRRRKYADGDARGEREKHRIYLISGAVLLPLVLAMEASVVYMVLWGRPSGGGLFMTFANVAYTVYKFSMALAHVFLSKRHGDPVARAMRNLNFADACMSAVSMTALLLTDFDVVADTDLRLAVKAAVGFAACAIVLCMAVVMIVTGWSALRKTPKPQGDGSYGTLATEARTGDIPEDCAESAGDQAEGKPGEEEIPGPQETHEKGPVRL